MEQPSVYTRTSTSSGPSVPRGLGGTPVEWCMTQDFGSVPGGEQRVLGPIDVSGSSSLGFMVVVTVHMSESSGGGG